MVAKFTALIERFDALKRQQRKEQGLLNDGFDAALSGFNWGEFQVVLRRFADE